MLHVGYCLNTDKFEVVQMLRHVQELHWSLPTRLQVLTTLYDMQLVTSNEATVDTLLDVHTPEYLQEIKTSKMKVAEVGCTSGNLLCLFLLYV